MFTTNQNRKADTAAVVQEHQRQHQHQQLPVGHFEEEEEELPEKSVCTLIDRIDATALCPIPCLSVCRSTVLLWT